MSAKLAPVPFNLKAFIEDYLAAPLMGDSAQNAAVDRLKAQLALLPPTQEALQESCVAVAQAGLRTNDSDQLLAALLGILIDFKASSSATVPPQTSVLFIGRPSLLEYILKSSRTQPVAEALARMPNHTLSELLTHESLFTLLISKQSIKFTETFFTPHVIDLLYKNGRTKEPWTYFKKTLSSFSTRDTEEVEQLFEQLAPKDLKAYQQLYARLTDCQRERMTRENFLAVYLSILGARAVYLVHTSPVHDRLLPIEQAVQEGDFKKAAQLVDASVKSTESVEPISFIERLFDYLKETLTRHKAHTRAMTGLSLVLVKLTDMTAYLQTDRSPAGTPPSLSLPFQLAVIRREMDGRSPHSPNDRETYSPFS